MYFLYDDFTTTRPSSGTAIDHVISNDTTIETIIHNMDVGFSDHNMILCEIKKINVRKYSFKNTITIEKTNNMMLLKDLQRTPITLNTDTADCNLVFNSFIDELHKRKQSYTTTKQIQVQSKDKPMKPWIDQELKKLIDTKQKWYNKYKKAVKNNRSIYDIEKIKQEMKYWEVKLLKIKNEKKKHFISNELTKNPNNMRQVWRGIKLACADGVVKPNPKIVIKTNQKLIVDRNAVANELNKHFVQIGYSLLQLFPRTTNYSTNSTSAIIHKFESCQTTKYEVSKIISNLKNTSSFGLDNFTIKMIKESSSAILDNLVFLINKSFSDGVFPDQLKLTKIIPVFKSGTKTEINNYRPIAITSVFSKIIESIFKDRLNKHIRDNGILYLQQYGFRSASNTTIALYDLCVSVQNSIFLKKKTAILFLDLKKAFDSVDIELLILKLKSLGVDGAAINWLSSFLTDRKQCVVVDGYMSSFQTTRCGVPQGTILGPVLFLLFINDIAKLPFSGIPYLYADDIALVYEDNTNDAIEMKMNNDLKLISTYLQSNKLLLNVAKTKYMIFNKNLTLNIRYRGEKVEQVEEFRYLGVILDNQLKFTSHIDYLEKKLASIAGVFHKISKYLSEATRKTVYYSLFHSNLIYGIEIWGSTCKTRMDRLQIMQNKAIKNIHQLDRLQRTRYIQSRYNIQAVNLIYEHKILNLTHSIINHFVHTNTNFSYNHDRHTYRTRTRAHLYVEKIHPHSIKYKCILAYNKLPLDVRSFGKFKFKITITNILREIDT